MLCILVFVKTVAGGDHCTFVNIQLSRDQVRCSVCFHVVGAHQTNFRWTNIVRIRVLRLAPVRVTSICHDQTEESISDSHQHQCILASVSQSRNSSILPIQFINIRRGHSQEPVCPFARRFDISSTDYPFQQHTRNISTQTNLKEDDIDEQVNELEDNISLPIVSSDDAFWETLNEEPSTSTGAFTQESINRAINASNVPANEDDSLVAEIAQYLIDMSDNVTIKNEVSYGIYIFFIFFLFCDIILVFILLFKKEEQLIYSFFFFLLMNSWPAMICKLQNNLPRILLK